MTKRIAAFTSKKGNFPDLVAITADDAGVVSLMVRQCVEVAPGTAPKVVNATVKMSPEEWANLLGQLNA